MPFDARQIRLFATLFIAVVLAIAALWYFFLRTEYVPVYENIRESDASKIVAELEEASISYELRNGGHDIFVAESQAAEARVVVAGADIPMGGTTGFELFNENDLGLTEFAQKINLQRAIQGELARTIMMMDGVEFARVHLAMPERTLFRSEQESPTAAVTVEMQPSRVLTAASVNGIRRLVASSVPGLSYDDVAVLNEGGGLMNSGPSEGVVATSAPANEREAVEAFLTVRARDAISATLPGQPFNVDISAFERVSEGETDDAGETDEESKRPAPRPIGLAGRSMRVLVRTPQDMGPEERTAVTSALVGAIDLSTKSGDVLDFTTGAITEIASAPVAGVPASQPAAIAAVGADTGSSSLGWDKSWNAPDFLSAWFLIPLVLLLLVLLAMRPRRQLSKDETDSFADLLRSASVDLETK